MFTLFGCIHVLTVLLGLAAGALLGNRLFGVTGLLLGAVAGILAGFLVGKLPFAFALWQLRRSLARCDSAVLEQRLETQYFLAIPLCEALVSRGVPPSQLRAPLLRLMRSESLDRRGFGWHALQRWLPGLAARIEGFDPGAPSDDLQQKLQSLEREQPG